MELKFRVYDKGIKQYLKLETGMEFMIDCKGQLYQYFYSEDKDCNIAVLVSMENYVVELSTELKDKNGVEIYEGDILDYFDNDGEEFCDTLEVIYVDNRVRWQFQSTEDGCMVHDNEWSIDELMEQCEVIGNIHDEKEDNMKDFKIRVVENIGKKSIIYFGEVGNVLKVKDGKIWDCEDNTYYWYSWQHRNGETPIDKINSCFGDEDKAQTKFELVEENDHE